MTLVTDFQTSPIEPALLFDFELDTGSQFFWTGDFDLAVLEPSLVTYLGLSNLELAVAIRESLDLSELAAEISFRGGRNEIVLLATTEQYQNRPVNVWFATLNDNVFSNRELLTRGRLSKIDLVTDSAEPLAEVVIESGPAFLRNTTDILYQSSSQRLINPTDTAFNFLEASRTNPQPFGRPI